MIKLLIYGILNYELEMIVLGRTYTVPRNVKGETRLLYIFSVKSLITTIIGAAVGAPFFFLFSAMNLTFAGIILLVVCAIIGYFIGVLTIPDSPLFGNLRKAGGEKVSEILIRTITFYKRRKIYIYRYKDEKNTIKQTNKTDTDDNTKDGDESEEQVI